jgi:hypothetical protein
MEVWSLMPISKTKFKSIFEYTFLGIIFLICGLALNENLVQPLVKQVIVSVIFIAWVSMFTFGFVFKESYILKAAKLSKPTLFYIEQLAYFVLLIINSIVIYEAVYT